MNAIICLDKKASQGAATVALSGSLGSLACYFFSNGVNPLLGGALAVYASAITIVALTTLTKQSSQRGMWFPLIGLASTCGLCFAGAALGFPVTASLALVLSVVNIASMALGLNLFQCPNP